MQILFINFLDIKKC